MQPKLYYRFRYRHSQHPLDDIPLPPHCLMSTRTESSSKYSTIFAREQPLRKDELRRDDEDKVGDVREERGSEEDEEEEDVDEFDAANGRGRRC